MIWLSMRERTSTLAGVSTKPIACLRTGKSAWIAATETTATGAPSPRVIGWITGAACATLVAAGLFVTIETCFPPLDWTLR